MMRKLLVILPVVAIATASAAALVISAGPSGAGAGTIGYTVYFPPSVMEDGTTEPDEAALELPPTDVGAAQDPNCDAQLSTVDLASGVVTPLPAAPSGIACAGDLAFAPDGTLYGLVQGESPDGGPVAELVTFDLTTGEATLVGAFGPFALSIGGAGELPSGGITFDGTGTLYALLGSNPVTPGFDSRCGTGDVLAFCLYRVDDPANPGATTFLGLSTTEEAASALAASCEAVYAAHTANDGESSTVSTVDTANGAFTNIGAAAPERFLEGFDFDFAGTFWGVIVDNSDIGFTFELATLDPAGGTPIDTPGPEMTVEGDEFPFFNALGIPGPDCTPEPAPIVLEPTFTG